eukprot:5328692-Prymnesium_polylepis.1
MAARPRRTYLVGGCRFGTLVAAYLRGHTTRSCTLVTRYLLFRRASSVAAELARASLPDSGHATPACGAWLFSFMSSYTLVV